MSEESSPTPKIADDGADTGTHRSDPTVPMWVAVVVLAAVFVFAGLGGYFLRGFIGERPTAVAEVANAEIERWTAAVRRDPEDLRARMGLGYAYQVARRWDLALNQYAFVIRKDPTNTGALYQQGIIYRDLGLGNEAEVSLWKVLELEPEHVLAATALGRYYAGAEQYTTMVTAVRPAVDAHPNSAELQYLLGLAYENLDERQPAIDRYRLALQVAPDFTEAHAGLLRLGALTTD